MTLYPLEHRPFEPQVEGLLALCGELTLDDDLIAATQKLRDAAVEHDRADARFVEAANEVMALLVGKLP